MSFGLEFQEGVKKGIPMGLQSFLHTKDSEAKNARELEKLRVAKQKEQKQIQAKADFLNLPTHQGDGGLEIDFPDEGLNIDGVTEQQRLQFLPDTDDNFRKIVTQLDKENQPEDFYVNKNRQLDPSTGLGIITATDTRTGDRVKIGNDQFYVPKITDETMFEGVIEIDGQKIGIKGKWSKLIQYEDGKFDILEGIKNISKGSGESADSILFESKLARLNVNKQKALERYDTYISKGDEGSKGDFGNPLARDLKRQRINADLNRVAWDYAELGSLEAQGNIARIFNDGKNTIGKGFVGHPVSRKDFYEREYAELIAEYGRGEWGYNDFLATLQFMKAKYKDYVVSQDAVIDKNEITFDLPELIVK